MGFGSVRLAGKLTTVLENHTAQWAILLVASYMVLFAHAQAELTGGDPVLYAREARLIADTGEYATLRFGQEVNHHGPLLFWLTALAIKILGANPVAATLFSRLFGMGCIILTGSWDRICSGKIPPGSRLSHSQPAIRLSGTQRR